MNENGWVYALGEGWLKAVVFGVAAAIGTWLMKRPIEHAGILGAFQALADGQYVRFEREIKRLEDARKADNEDCDRKLAEMQSTIDRLMNGPVALYDFQTKPYGWGQPSAPQLLLEPEDIKLPRSGLSANVPWFIAGICGAALILVLILSGCESTPPYGPGAALPHPHVQDLEQCRTYPDSVFCRSAP